MSRKVNTFASIITQPLNVHNFYVDIPGVTTASIVVSAADFPSEKMRKMILHFQGEEIRYPTIPSNQGEWKIKVPENDKGEIRRQLDSLKSARWDQKSGILSPTKWFDPIITARDLQLNPVFSCIMHGAWLVGRDQLNLSNADPTKNWEWDYEFCYQWIEDIDLNNDGSPSPV